MQAMQDKEFDKVFKDNLYEAEIEPSKDLWSSIEAEITPKRKTINFRYWSIAATVLLLATITMVIYKQQPATTTTKLAKVAPSAKYDEPTNKIAPSQIARQKSIASVEVRNVNLVVREEKKPPRKLLASSLEKTPVIQLDTDLKTEVTQSKILKPQKEEVVVIESIKPLQENTMLASAQVISQEKPIDEEISETPKGIRSAGDLINLVVGVVDKGKDKIIRFKNTGEGSTLAAINIGPFRFGKRSD